MAAPDPVLVHGVQDLKDVAFAETQVVVVDPCVVTESAHSPAWTETVVSLSDPHDGAQGVSFQGGE